MLVLVVCDVIGGFLAVAEGVDTWDEAWGFNTDSTVPLPGGGAQLVLAWLAERNVRPPVGLIAAVVLSAFCLISLVFGLFDGDLINNVASAGWISWGVVWGVAVQAVRRISPFSVDRCTQLLEVFPYGGIARGEPSGSLPDHEPAAPQGTEPVRAGNGMDRGGSPLTRSAAAPGQSSLTSPDATACPGRVCRTRGEPTPR